MSAEALQMPTVCVHSSLFFRAAAQGGFIWHYVHAAFLVTASDGSRVLSAAESYASLISFLKISVFHFSPSRDSNGRDSFSEGRILLAQQQEVCIERSNSFLLKQCGCFDCTIIDCVNK